MCRIKIVPFLIILLCFFVLGSFAAECKVQNNKREQPSCLTNEGCNPPDGNTSWTYTGKTTWKINDHTILDAEIYCKDIEGPLPMELWFDSTSSGRLCIVNHPTNKSTKDSIIHKSGYWEISEMSYSNGGVRVSMRLEGYGRSIIHRYDSLGRLETVTRSINTVTDSIVKILRGENVMTANMHLMPQFERYVWGKNGRLIQTIIDDKVSDFIYGTPCDSIIVQPPDFIRVFDGILEECTYHGSFGKMPAMDDPEYQRFAEDPDGYKATPQVLERQIARCEEYKKSQMKEPK